MITLTKSIYMCLHRHFLRVSLIFVILYLHSIVSFSPFQSHNVNSIGVMKSLEANKDSSVLTQSFVPTNGIITDYIGRTESEQINRVRKDIITHLDGLNTNFIKPTSSQQFLTRFNLWRQWPWKKIKGKVILKARLSGSLSLEPVSRGLFSQTDPEQLSSLADADKMLRFGAHDPRVTSILLDIDRVSCGYAKLIELRRSMQYFRQANKTIIGYCSSGSEKEFYIALGCDEIYVPPDGGFDMRGFSSSATFLRGFFDKIGIEPQVQRIGKYKSFGDTINRYNISEAQREVVSSLIMEASNFWVQETATSLNKSQVDVLSLWNKEGIQTSKNLKEDGFVTGVMYLDQIESMLAQRYLVDNQTVVMEDFKLDNEFEVNPRRNISMLLDLISNNSNNTNSIKSSKRKPSKKSLFIYPVGRYLQKMRKGDKILKGLKFKETPFGGRIGVINAIGGINSGKSSSGPTGTNLGSDSFISLIRQAAEDNNIKAVVIRVDSPGGSALASDLMWREIRSLAKKKPVIASQCDVAASGGYYISMACDFIVAEALTVTGSIGVVSSKFNSADLNNRLGFEVENISRGRYAEVLASSRGFTDEERKYFEDSAKQAYYSFTSKAAASRNMTLEEMEEVAQGRVWTGRQAMSRGLVDFEGGLQTSINIAATLAGLNTTKELKYQVLREAKSGFTLPFGISSSSRQNDLNRRSDVMALCSDEVYLTGLTDLESIGLSNSFMNIGLSPNILYSLFSQSLQGDALATLLLTLPNKVIPRLESNWIQSVVSWLEETF